ncbi:MAG: CoA-binding protein [Candidatus Veblenbacteria bacterium]|nr:CoA-binding protein [Candidatus Veblenbacteria bacterium]MDZ4229578.1 CoA-binding protein [Candidatus Veblenbacteria bacterium]
MLEDFVSKDFYYALVGATTNQEKYGYRVLKDLAGAGFNIVGVNLRYQEIDGIPVYPKLKDVPQKPDVVIFVVPPEVGIKLLDEVAALGVGKVWFQPGAESEEIRTKAQTLGLKAMADGSCIMVARRVLGL